MPKTPVSVSMVAQLIGATIEGDPSVMVRSFAAMDSAGPQDITFAVDEKYAAKLSSCKAAAAVIDKKSAAPDAKMTLLRVDSVQKAVAKLLQFAGEPEDLPQSGINPTAIIAADAQVAADAAVGPHVVVGARAKIGPGAILCANVWIGADVNVGEKTLLAEGVVVKPTCVIGNRVRIGPNSVIGWDGFGYYPEGGVHHRIPHVGNVVIEDDVDLGACTCIDRAKFGETRIGTGTKIDNLVQIAHNCQIAKGCLIVAQVGVAGSTKLGNYVVIGGNAGLRDNIKIGDGVQIAACAAVANDLPAGMVALGQPATDAKEEIRTIFAGRKLLPTLAAKIKSIEERLKALESTKND